MNEEREKEIIREYNKIKKKDNNKFNKRYKGKVEKK